MKLFISIVLLFISISAQERWIKLNGPGGGVVTGLFAKGDTVITGTGYDKANIFYSSDRGIHWKKANIKLTGRFEELTFTDDGAIVAINPYNGIYRSYDFDNWETLNITGQFWSLRKDKYGNIYAGTEDNRIYISTNNGDNWSISWNGYQYGHRVTDFHLTPDSIFFAGIMGKILRMNYKTNQWDTVLLDSALTMFYKIFSGEEGEIYASSLASILISQDSGTIWKRQPTGTFFYGESMNETIYNRRIIGAFQDETGWFGKGWGAAVSDDKGLSWRWSQNGLPYKISGIDLAVSGDDTYLGTNGAGVFKSTDFGESWFPVNNGINAAQTLKVIIDKEGTMYAASWSNGLSRSTDNGQSWEMINNGLSNVYFISIVSDDNGILLAGSEQGLYRSTDKGENWIRTPAAGNDFWYELSKDKYNRIYALVYGRGLYRTTDHGNNWERLDKGFISSSVFGLAIDKEDNIYAGSNGGALYKSADDGASWTKIFQSSVANSGIGAVAVSPAGDIFISNHGEGIIRITGDGQSWKLIKEDKGFIYPNFILTINSKGEIFTKGSNEHIYKSSDNGENWEDITSNAYLVNVNNFTLDKNDNLYLATDESVWKSNPDSLTSITEDENLTPGEYSLSQNYPNPFNPATVIKYQIPENGYVTLKIYDILGKEITTLENEEKSAGRYEVNFNALGLSSGVYIYQVKVNGFVASRKMMMMK